jgi:hypothetical protein
VRNSYSLRVALLADVFTRVIPLPLPPASPNGADARPGRCIWAATDVRHETQVLLLQSFQLLNTADAEFMTWIPSSHALTNLRHETQVSLLHALGLAARHLACACLSVRATRALDAARCVTFACIAAMADAAVRIVAADFPSQVAAARRREQTELFSAESLAVHRVRLRARPWMWAPMP